MKTHRTKQQKQRARERRAQEVQRLYSISTILSENASKTENLQKPNTQPHGSVTVLTDRRVFARDLAKTVTITTLIIGAEIALWKTLQ